MRHLISGELTNYRVVRTSPEPIQTIVHVRDFGGNEVDFEDLILVVM
jgi:hypothetical protein